MLVCKNQGELMGDLDKQVPSLMNIDVKIGEVYTLFTWSHHLVTRGYLQPAAVIRGLLGSLGPRLLTRN